jgi:hypothetical protein
MIKNAQVELISVSQNARAAIASVEHQFAQAMRLREQAQTKYEAFIRSTS